MASGSASARGLMMAENMVRASAGSRTSRSTKWDPARSGIQLRVVTRTAHEADPGSSGLTWAASFASSRTMSTFRSVSRLR